MLVFKMDTTNFFRHGQRHELRILFPRGADKRLSPRTSVVNGLAKQILGRSNSHYISRSSTNLSTPDFFPSRTPPRETLVSSGYSDKKEIYPVPPVRRRRKNSCASQKSNRRAIIEQSGSLLEDVSQGLVSIRMRPDDNGKFGFNVKGGADQQQPVLVSRVTPGMPAHRCYPRLNEGDQVLYINGEDVSRLSHEQVVHLIRTSRSNQTLILTVKQNVYEPEGMDEPAFQYVPETLPVDGISGLGALEESMLLLTEALESGSLLGRFEQLYRRKPGLSMTEAKKPENDKKNRYRDISPYDSTRVLCKSLPSGDYINASYVNMEISGSGIVNRYIACQGPLSSTCLDFWYMVWEQRSTLLVMLTTVVEQGRVKCHRYWPKLNETNEFGKIKVTCVKEEETPGFAFREFTVANSQTEDSPRHITHMQYLAWPDHGVPDDSTDFLHFVARVRESKLGMVEPTIVHCSAGIGRTGVLILMETAQCLIESNQPVYPLDIVRTMRDQRAMMIQTVRQYKFVCEGILRVYRERLVVPLSEYQR